MDCKKQVSTTFNEGGVTGTSTFTFHSMKVTVEITQPIDPSYYPKTSDLELMPIRLAIKNLQDLLPPEAGHVGK